MHLHVTGPAEAPTILFIHAAGTSGWMWEPIVERLGGFGCLVPDPPGHGRSADVVWHSVYDTVDSLADLISRHALGGRAHVVGLSLGAQVALRLLAPHPAVVEGAVLSGVNVLRFPRPGPMRLMGYMMVPLMKRDFVLRVQARALRIPGDRLDGYRSAARAMSLRAFLRIGNELMDFRAGADLGHAASPTLVLAGHREHGLTRQSIPELVRALPSAQGYLVPGVGHGWSGEAPELFARTLEAWVTGEALPAELRALAE